jgi:hypothetical protein
LPYQRIPVTDGKYFALLLGETAVIVIKAIEDKGSEGYECTGTVHSRREIDCDDMIKWFEGVKRQAMKILSLDKSAHSCWR